MDRYRCEFEGRFKVVAPDGHCTKLYCAGHAQDWVHHLNGSIVEPRRFSVDRLIQPLDTYRCYGDWRLPASVPGFIPDDASP